MKEGKIIPLADLQLKRWEKQLEERRGLAAPYDDPAELTQLPKLPENITVFRPKGS